jgi:hypothetical protein
MRGKGKRNAHVLADLDQDVLEAAGAGPVCEDGELCGVDVAVDLVDEREIYAREELRGAHINTVKSNTQRDAPAPSAGHPGNFRHT